MRPFLAAWLNAACPGSDRDPPIEIATDMQIGAQIVRDVFVGGGQKEPHAELPGQSLHAEGDDPGEGPVERGREFIRHDPGRPPRDGQRQPESGPLTVAQFTRPAQHEAGFAEPALCQDLHGRRRFHRKLIDEQSVSQRQLIKDQDGRGNVRKVLAQGFHGGPQQ